jgi:hypothetical protein
LPGEPIAEPSAKENAAAQENCLSTPNLNTAA